MTAALNAKLSALQVPRRLRARPVDERGFLVPWFVAIVDGKPDHRVVDTDKMAPAIKHRLCWLCGEPLGRFGTFIIGPMCLVSLNVSEPPSHQDCARFAVQACPFLTQPKAERREGLPDQVKPPAGFGFSRNPGVTVLCATRTWQPFRAPRVGGGKQGLLWRIDEPLIGVEWWARGREATRAEAQESLESGFPKLLQVAELQDQHEPGAGAVAFFHQRLAQARALLPAEAAPPDERPEVRL